MLNTGDSAPAFTLPDQMGRPVSLEDFRGKWVVLYFYPRDNTSGCTKEAVDFTAMAETFASRGAVVIGVSPDSPASHVNFITRHTLGIRLLADPGREVMSAYGAIGIKKNYGREFEGVIRSTVLISPEGRVAQQWTNVKVHVKRKDGVVRHVDKVYERLVELT